jgi:hypothetical protein
VLEWLDQFMEVFCRRAVNDADVQCGLLVAKLIERRSVLLGLNAPAPMTLQIFESTAREADDDGSDPAGDRLPGGSRSREG